MPGFTRLALINVRIESRQRIPIGLLTLAAYVRDICNMKVFDPDPDQNEFEDIIRFKPDLIGVGFMTQTRNRALQIYKALRKNFPDTVIILGGVGPTVDRKNIFKLFQPDALVIGEGEKALRAIVSSGLKEGVPGVYRPEWNYLNYEIVENLDNLPFPAYECMPDLKKYFCPPGGIRGKWFNSGTPMIMTGRGCPYRCTFCSSRLMFGQRVRRRSVLLVIDEIRRLHNDYGVDAVYFFDDTFNAPPKWARQFCEALLAEPYRMTWGCQIRVNLFDMDLARLMRKAGCVQVDIGVESGSSRVLQAIHKDETVEQIIAAFDVCHSAGISPMGTFLVGCPDETWEDVELTKKLLRRIRPSFAEFFYLIPYPGSELYDQALSNGWLVDKTYEGRGMVDHPVMKINFTLEEQVKIRREYFRMMAWRNLVGYLSLSVIWQLLIRVRPFMMGVFLKEWLRSRNLRDAMQAFVHALRNNYRQAV